MDSEEEEEQPTRQHGVLHWSLRTSAVTLAAWRLLTARRRWHRSLLRRAVWRLSTRVFKRTFDAWRLAVANKHRLESLLQRHTRKAQARIIAHCFLAWRSAASQATWRRSAVETASRQKERDFVRTLFSAWRAHASVVARRDAAICRVLFASHARAALMTCFDAWRLQNNASLERTQALAAALGRMDANMQHRVLHAWMDVVQSCRRLRVLQDRASARLSLRRLRAAFLEWASVAEEQRVQAIKDAALASSSLETDNALRERAMDVVDRVAALAVKSCRRATALSAWRAAVADASRRAAAASSSGERVQRARVRHAFDNWKGAFQQSRAQGASAHRLALRIERSLLHSAWHEWQAVCQERRRRYEAAGGVRQMRLLRTAFRAWHRHADAVGAVNAALKARRDRRVLRAAFSAWTSRRATQRVTRDDVPALRARHAAALTRRMLFAWRLVAAVTRRKASGAVRLAAQRQRKQLSQILQAWAENTEASRARARILDASVAIIDANSCRRVVHDALHAWRLAAVEMQRRQVAAYRMASASLAKRTAAAFREWQSHAAHSRRTRMVLEAALMRRNVRLAVAVLWAWHREAATSAEQERGAAAVLAAGLQESGTRSASSQLSALAVSRAAANALAAMRRRHVLRLVLTAWHSNTMAQLERATWMRAMALRRAKRAASAVLHAWCTWTRRRLACRATVTGAVNARRTRTLASCVQAWRVAVTYAASLRDLESRVTAHVESSIVRRCFMAWAESAVLSRRQAYAPATDAIVHIMARIRARRAMAAVLTAWQAWTSEHLAREALLARHLAVMQQRRLRRCFRAWLESASRRSIADVHIARLKERRRLRALRTVLACWRSSVDMSHVRHIVLSHMAQHAAWRAAHRVFVAWRDIAAAERIGLVVFARSTQRRTLSAVFVAWCDTARVMRERRQAAAERAWANDTRVLLIAFGAWATVTARKLSASASVERARSMLSCSLQRRVLAAWHTAAREQSLALGVFTASHARRRLHRAFYEWHHVRETQDALASLARATFERRRLALCMSSWRMLCSQAAEREAKSVQAAARVQLRLVRSAFLAWCHQTTQLRLAREMASRLAAQRCAATARLALHTWRVAVVHAERVQSAASAMRQRILDRDLRLVLWAWHEEAKQTAAQGAATAADSAAEEDRLRTMQLALHEAALSNAQRLQSTAIVARCFSAWRRATHARAASHVALTACAVVVLAHLRQRQVFRHWRALAAMRIQSEDIVLRHLQHRRRVTLARMFTIWAMHSMSLRKARAAAIALQRASHRRLLTLSLAAWQGATSSSAAAHAAAERMAHRASLLHARQLLTAWRMQTQRQIRLAYLLRTAQHGRETRTMRVCISAWRAWSARRAARQALLRVGLQQLLTKRMHAYFSPWRAWTQHAKWRRHQLRIALQHRRGDALRERRRSA